MIYFKSFCFFQRLSSLSFFRFTLLISFVATLSCSHTQVQTDSDPTVIQATQLAFIELRELKHRAPAKSALSPKDSNLPRLESFRNLKPKQFEVYIIPKVQSMNAKESREIPTYWGPPAAFEISPVGVAPCHEFTHKNLFANELQAKSVFENRNSQDKKELCAIIEVIDLSLAKQNKNQLHFGDTLGARIFIDDTYSLWATDWITYNRYSDPQISRLLSNGNIASSSGMSLLPIDMPNFNLMNWGSEPLQSISALRVGLDETAIKGIQKKFNKKFSLASCHGHETTYNDAFGNPVRVGWCPNQPWPLYTENSHFISVTQPLDVK